MAGRGAWSYGRYHRGMEVPEPRVAAGILAFKRELVYIGKGAGIVVDLPLYGNAIEARVAEFQAASGLLGDWGVHEGEIDRKTARYLFWSRANRIALARGIPNRFLSKLKTLESADDPVAEGYVDDRDEGLMQIHLPYHPDWTEERAWDPAQAMTFGGDYLRSGFDFTGDWDGAVASYNVGLSMAERWVDAGKPASMVVNGFDWGKRATDYVRLVKAQPVF